MLCVSRLSRWSSGSDFVSRGVKDTTDCDSAQQILSLSFQVESTTLSCNLCWFLFSVLTGTLAVDNHLTDSACTGDHCPRCSNACPEAVKRRFYFNDSLLYEVDSVRKGSFEWTVRTLNCF